MGSAGEFRRGVASWGHLVQPILGSSLPSLKWKKAAWANTR